MVLWWSELHAAAGSLASLHCSCRYAGGPIFQAGRQPNDRASGQGIKPAAAVTLPCARALTYRWCEFG